MKNKYAIITNKLIKTKSITNPAINWLKMETPAKVIKFKRNILTKMTPGLGNQSFIIYTN